MQLKFVSYDHIQLLSGLNFFSYEPSKRESVLIYCRILKLQFYAEIWIFKICFLMLILCPSTEMCIAYMSYFRFRNWFTLGAKTMTVLTMNWTPLCPQRPSRNLSTLPNSAHSSTIRQEIKLIKSVKRRILSGRVGLNCEFGQYILACWQTGTPVPMINGGGWSGEFLRSGIKTTTFIVSCSGIHWYIGNS